MEKNEKSKTRNRLEPHAKRGPLEKSVLEKDV